MVRQSPANTQKILQGLKQEMTGEAGLPAAIREMTVELKKAIENTQDRRLETVVKQLHGSMTELVTHANDLSQVFKEAGEHQKKTLKSMRDVAKTLGPATTKINTSVKSLEAATSTFNTVLETISGELKTNVTGLEKGTSSLVQAAGTLDTSVTDLEVHLTGFNSTFEIVGNQTKGLGTQIMASHQSLLAQVTDLKQREEEVLNRWTAIRDALDTSVADHAAAMNKASGTASDRYQAEVNQMVTATFKKIDDCLSESVARVSHLVEMLEDDEAPVG